MEKYILSCTASLNICCPAADSFFQTAFLDKQKERIPPQDMPSYVGWTLCSKYSVYTGMIREAEGEIRLRMGTEY